MQDYEIAAERLSAALEGFQLQATPIDTRTGDLANSTWSKDATHFRIVIIAPNGATWDGEYSAGSAHALNAARDAAEGSGLVWQEWRKLARKNGASLAGLNLREDIIRLAGKWRPKRTIFEADLERELRKAYRPGIADVIGCLFLDASGVSELTTFREWCDEYGTQDGANPADILDSFEACKRAALFLRRAFGDQFETLAEVACEL